MDEVGPGYESWLGDFPVCCTACGCFGFLQVLWFPPQLTKCECLGVTAPGVQCLSGGVFDKCNGNKSPQFVYLTLKLLGGRGFSNHTFRCNHIPRARSEYLNTVQYVEQCRSELKI